MAYSRREFIAASLNAGLGAAVMSSASPLVEAAAQSTAISDRNGQRVPKRHNVLLLYPDQWRFDWMSANPRLPIRTPNLDHIAKRGMRFTNALVASPLCSPSRACLASGMEYDRNLTPDNDAIFPSGRLKTFYGALRDGGYHVLACGKLDLAKGALWFGLDGKWRLKQWGFSDGINNAGKFDQLWSYNLNNDQPADPYLMFLKSRNLLDVHLRDLRSRLGKNNYGNTDPAPLPQDAYCDDWITQNGLKLLDESPKDKPWFLQVNWAGPHCPEDVTSPMETTVRKLKMPAPNGKNQFDAAKNQAIRQNYTAMCENIDRNIGLFLNKLRQRGELENTIIVFSSDHGEMLGDHGRWEKSVPYHPSVSVPLLVAGPGIKANTSTSALVSNIDLGATFLDFAEVAPMVNDGKSLRRVLSGAASEHRDVVLSGLGSWRMAFDGRYKAVSHFNQRYNDSEGFLKRGSKPARSLPDMIFDLEADPGENNDLQASPPAVARRLLEIVNTPRGAEGGL